MFGDKLKRPGEVPDPSQASHWAPWLHKSADHRSIDHCILRQVDQSRELAELQLVPEVVLGGDEVCLRIDMLAILVLAVDEREIRLQIGRDCRMLETR